MAVTRTCTLNGATLWPDTIDDTPEKFGDEFVAADGSRTTMVAGTKRQWVLKWESPPETVRTQVTNLFLLNTTMVFVDPDGASYTVSCPLKALKRGIEYVQADVAYPTMFPSLELTIQQV